MKKLSLLVLMAGLLGAGCAPLAPGGQPATSPPATAAFTSPTPTAPPAPTVMPRLQPRLTPVVLLGPERDQFPDGVNPLTGLRVQDASMLDLPAVLVSISNMPVTARPQAGMHFAAWIFELFIGEGTSRFMGVFYGDYPRRIPNATGECGVDPAPLLPQNTRIGNRVWLDENQNGIQETWEAGVGNICVNLYADGNYEQFQVTQTDSNGYFGFSLPAAPAGIHAYELEFVIPPGDRTAVYRFTTPDAGNDDQDSDANPLNGRTQAFTVEETDASWDAGLVLVNPPPPIYSPSDIAPQRTYAGPIRSGRLTYNDFYSMLPGSCLVYASAGEGIRQALHGCQIIYGEHPDEGPNTALLDVDRMLELARQSKVPNQPVNYSGNLFSEIPPAGGLPADSLWTFFHAYTQALWQYSPLSGAYLRQTDDADGKGVFHPDTDRLTGRQLAFENVIIILADYEVVRHGQYDINLRYGLEGYAYVFRDGQLYNIRWSTANREWEQKTGLLRPIHFIDTAKQPFPLKPGRTWISIMTLGSVVENLDEGKWRAYFNPPDDTADPK